MDNQQPLSILGNLQVAILLEDSDDFDAEQAGLVQGKNWCGTLLSCLNEQPPHSHRETSPLTGNDTKV